mmetsp:Transcript_5723/g.12996  ORF Transcript_5723/g.12996 Transcript_5723/m.12996 type:complete len:948 (-) Transcript_5723:272-3115(-)
MPPPSRFRGKLNPAFSAAHGISNESVPTPAPTAAGQRRRPQGQGQSRTSSSSSNTGIGGSRTKRTTPSSSAPPPPTTKSREQKVQAALRTARLTGRLLLCDCNLTSLPDQMFDLRSGIEIDLSLDSSSNPSRGSSLGEEELTSVDVSDNDLSEALMDERVERFRSLSVFRARRSKLTKVPWRSLGLLDCLTVLDLSGNCLSGSAMVECLPTFLRELNLSGNELTSLTTSLESDVDDGKGDGGTLTMPHLLSLDISNNQLECLPSALGAPNLQTLNFSNNQIAILPANLLATCSRSLLTLEGKNNRLGSPPPDLRVCTSLRIVDLGRNAFTDAPAVNSSLVCLSLEGNRLSNLDNLFGGDQVDDESFRSSLTELRISTNKLTTFDEDVARCLTSAIMIDASMNDLSDLPHCVGYLPVLRRIMMDGNPCLRRIRPQLLNDTGALKAFLRKRGGPPDGGGYLDAPRVEEGDVCLVGGTGRGVGSGGGGVASTGTGGGGGAAKASQPRTNKWRNIVNDALVGTFKLDLRNQRLNSLPEGLCNELSKADTSAAGSSGRQRGYDDDGGDASAIDTVGKRIRRLDLSNNAFTCIDGRWFKALPDLVSLNAGKNRIDTLPESMACIPLAEIIMNRNLLTSETISGSVLCRSMVMAKTTTTTLLFRSLTTLDLSGNRLEWFPSEICNLPNLVSLVLSGNGIKTLAADESLSTSSEGGQRCGWIAQQEFCSLPSLELLDLSSNKIADLGTLPDCLAEAGGGKGSLRALLLNYNELRTLPPRLGDVRSLTTIDLRGNPQRGTRPAVLEKGCEDILAYLRGRKAPLAAGTAVAAATNSVTTTGARSMASSVAEGGVRMGDSNEVVALGRTVGDDVAVGAAATPISSSSNISDNNDDSNENEEKMLADRVAELTQTVDDFRMKLHNVHLSEAMKYKMKKDMAKFRSELIREERRLRSLRG